MTKAAPLCIQIYSNGVVCCIINRKAIALIVRTIYRFELMHTNPQGPFSLSTFHIYNNIISLEHLLDEQTLCDFPGADVFSHVLIEQAVALIFSNIRVSAELHNICKCIKTMIYTHTCQLAHVL